MNAEKQFQLCEICRRNHDHGERHVYSKMHKKSLEKMLNKFSEKVLQMHTALKSVCVLSDSSDETFWCYICRKEVRKHLLMQGCYGQFGGVAEHFCSAEHKHNLTVFSKLHRLDEKKLEKFSLEESKFTEYLKTVSLAGQNHLAIKQEKLKEEFSAILKAEQENRIIASSQTQNPGWERHYMTSALPGTSSYVMTSYSSSRVGAENAVRTIEAKGDGLTCIRIQDEDFGGNVHSGAPPPWLHTPAQTTGGAIGPTMEDFEKHQRAERRKKLPSSRVGADLERNQPSCSGWLPAFGQVWSKKRATEKTNKKRMPTTEDRSAKSSHATSAVPSLKRMKYERR